MTFWVSVASVHLPWPIVIFEWTSFPSTVTSKFPVTPGSPICVTFTSSPHSFLIVSVSATEKRL